MRKLINWIKSKIPFKKVTLPKQTQKELVLEADLMFQLKGILNNFMVDYPNLFRAESNRSYWVCFFTAIAYCESGYNRFTRYLEPAPLHYESLGLYQLSYVDKNNYPFCDISGDKIFEVYNNAYCAVGILNKLMRNNTNAIDAGGKYWSVLQPRRTSHKRFQEKLKQLLKENFIYN